MRRIFIILFVVGLVSFAYAGSLRNRDFRQYHLELQFPDGRIGNMIVPANGTVLGFCDRDGCGVMIRETRDFARVGPNDDVVIFYGRLQVRRGLFR